MQADLQMGQMFAILSGQGTQALVAIYYMEA